ncbi:MAG TPA: TolC family protein, partial [Methylomirabilota bacterium]|nr:TolC family protein [Methylomirabilota bacterium]
MRKSFVRSLCAMGLCVLLGTGPVTPVFGQQGGQNPPPAPPAQQQAPADNTPARSLGLGKHDYTHGTPWFPNIVAPYRPIQVERPVLTNSPRVEQLIQNGKLMLSMQDAIELALENSMDIAVARYNPWIADTDILRSKGGGIARGLSGTGTASALGNIPSASFDPQITSTVSFDDRNTPVNNPFISGAGTSSLGSFSSHTATYNTQYTQGFHTGTSLFTGWDNTRSSSSLSSNLFNPAVQQTLFLGVSQQLLNGFGLLPNTRNILIAKNNRKLADLQFAQQAISTVTSTITAYWELVFARENVKVQQHAVDVAEKLYSDNKKQLEIGTMAPLDVTRAESELATDRGNLIVAQTAQLQQQQVLMNAITKNPLDPRLVQVEIVPTDMPTRPEQIEAANFEDAVKEAFSKRPDILQMIYNLKNAEINVKVTKNALLPVATVSAQYASVGLGGDSIPTAVGVANPFVEANGTTPGVVLDTNGNPVFVQTTVPAGAVVPGGLGDATHQVFRNTFPDYSITFSISVPIRNRQAQADSQRAILTQRQTQVQDQQLRNAAILDVRNTYIALVQDRARVEAAVKARQLQEETFQAEQKKYQLGASTVYLVIQTQRDLITAQGNELRALVDLVEAKANYERALGRTLEANRVTIADGKSGSG